MNEIHPTVIITGDVKLGANNKILPYCTLQGPLEIGDNNIIGPHVVLGSPGQDTRNPRYDSSQCRVRIGNDTIIREFSAVQKPCYADITELKDRVHLMQSVHIPHDAILEEDVVVTPMVVFAGLVRIMQGAFIAMGATLHQYTVVGPYAIVAQGSAVLKNVKPFSRYIPGKPPSVNHYLIEKYGLSEHLEEITAYVLHDRTPTTPKIANLVARYQEFHVRSKRPQY